MKKLLCYVLLLLILNLTLAACSSNNNSEVLNNTSDLDIETSPPTQQTTIVPSTSSSIRSEVTTPYPKSEEKVITPSVNPISTPTTPPNTLPQYYDYQGGDLPKDIITPINYVSKAKINKDKPEFIFELYGTNVQSYGTTVDKKSYYVAHNYNKINKIIVECNAINYKQELVFDETLTPNITTYPYGFSFDDWNFDGYLDISLWSFEGGTMGNSPHYYWLWDKDKNTYIENTQLGGLSDEHYVEIDEKNSLITVSQKYSAGYYMGYYQWKNNNLLLIKTDEVTFEPTNDKEPEKYRGHHIVKEFINEEMKITKDFYDDVY